MEDEIAEIFVNFARSVVVGTNPLNRIHVMRNAIVFRMDWRTLHCPFTVANRVVMLLNREGACRQSMAVVFDLVFSSLIGNDSFFTQSVAIDENTPRGPSL